MIDRIIQRMTDPNGVSADEYHRLEMTIYNRLGIDHYRAFRDIAERRDDGRFYFPCL